MTCPNCAADLEDGARFCGACGKRIEAAAPPVDESAPTRSLDVPAHASAGHRPIPEPVAAGVQAGSAAVRAGASPMSSRPYGNLGLDQTMLAPGGAPGGAARPAPNDSGAHRMSAPPRPAPVAAPVAAVAPVKMAAAAAASPAPTIVSSVEARAERKSENSGSRDDMVGRTLNKRYFVGEKIGEGGFGAVFRGKQLATGREVALKILHPYNLSDKTIVARFRREAEACSRLRNTHTVITYDFDETEDGVLYLAMELLRGRSLHQLERAEGTLEPDRVLRIIDQVAEALGEAHQNGIVHRDMKPENVFVERRGDEDYVKVLDFGIAKVMTDDRTQAALTAVGQTLGTLEFMSPEQLRGLPLDGRSDIYALGIMAYEMLTGDLPFKDAKTPVQIINFHMQKPAPPPSRLKPSLQIPAYVDEVILKMVGKAREDRHADTAALRAHIAQVLKGADKRADRFEAYWVVGVIGAAVAIVSALVYFLSR